MSPRNLIDHPAPGDRYEWQGHIVDVEDAPITVTTGFHRADRSGGTTANSDRMSDNTTAWKTPRQLAEDRVANMLGLMMPNTDRAIDETHAEAIVAAVFNVLAEPDRDMLEAGRRELDLAVPPEMRQRAYVRRLAAAVWRSMFAEAR